MSDLIDRQAIIDMVKCWNLNQHIMNEEDAIDDVNALPSAHPDIDLIHLQKEQAYMQGYADGKKARKGKWIESDYHIIICSEFKRPRRDNRVGHINFCNSCGAMMEVGEQK